LLWGQSPFSTSCAVAVAAALEEEGRMAQPIPFPAPETPEGTTLPANIEAEAALLGAMMIDNRVAEDALQRLRPEHFFEPLHGRIYDAIAMMVGDNRLATPVTLRPLFAADPAMKELGGPAYLAQLTGNPASLIGAKAFADQVYDLAILRALVSVGRELVTRRSTPARTSTPPNRSSRPS
jgi:replicative DNA helicase